MGRKLGGCAPFGGAESPCNTMWPGPRPTFVPSGILIHPAFWPQQTWAKNGGLCLLSGEEGTGFPSCSSVLGTTYTHSRFPFFVTLTGATSVAPVCVTFIGSTFLA